MTLAELSRELPTEEEIAQLKESLKNESDRGMALISAALVESGLYLALNSRFANYGDEQRKVIFHGIGAPLGTFSAKIALGFSLGIYGPDMRQNLVTIKDIRNAFAHALRALEFSNPTIKKECTRLTLLKPLESDSHSPRQRYYLVTQTIFALLLRFGYENAGQTFRVDIP